MKNSIDKLTESRKLIRDEYNLTVPVRKPEEEGGCGVVGFCCSEPVPGKHIYEPSVQMHNRGNGKGGGISAVGFVPEQLGVSRETLDECYMLHIALLDPSVKDELEQRFITPYFDVTVYGQLDTVEDWRSIEGLEAQPPDVWRYFVRVKADELDSFIDRHKLSGINRREAEDEFVNQNSFKLNQEYYASLGEQKAFVLSHGRNIMILKVVGYAEAIVTYYRIEEICAHVWIAHQRYPTKGRVWHPGGAHPFAGINMALVHNGDFANYHSVTEYLNQRNIYPQFLTDTEVAALLFDLLDRTYHYPLEYIIEAMAPTTELDFDRLSPEKQEVYHAIQATHIHGSPDGPWFFIIARNNARDNTFQLLGITDTAMLRPQVFAFSDGDVQVGVISSEKQAIDATLLSLSDEDSRICPIADRYWNARGGSHNDGGAFIFSLKAEESGMRVSCTDKFGESVPMPGGSETCDLSVEAGLTKEKVETFKNDISELYTTSKPFDLYRFVSDSAPQMTFDELREACRLISDVGKGQNKRAVAIEALTLLNDRIYPSGTKKRSSILHCVRSELDKLFRSMPRIDTSQEPESDYCLIDYDSREALRPPSGNESVLVVDAGRFPPEGEDCDASVVLDAYIKGWRQFICFGYLGQRFAGCGFGPETTDVTIDVYGSSGDYLGSGIDGLTISVHNNAQDQVGQIIKSGKLVIHGDVGQTFMYGAKGGAVYIRGNAAGRPLINAVGKPRVVINGTCLDFLAESFMAGDPQNGGGFVILNGISFDDDGKVVPLQEPYPGCNLFSLASGGAIYIRDPHKTVVEQQLNGGSFLPISVEDKNLILPLLEENEQLFGITIDDLLTVDGKRLRLEEVFRKVSPVRLKALASGISDVYVNGKTVEEIIME